MSMKTPQKPKFDEDTFIGGAMTAKGADSAPATRRKKGIPPEGTIRATYNFPKSIHKALKARAVEEDKTMLKMVLDAIEHAYGIKSNIR